MVGSSPVAQLFEGVSAMVSTFRTMLAGSCLVALVVFGTGANSWSETKAKSDAGQGEITVNGVVISHAQRTALEQAYGPVKPGRYWYDKVSGLWGQDGKTTIGQIMPGLDLGGSLKANASHGTTKVFLNGRELTQAEVQTLQQLGPVNPGHYWVNAQGVGGLEGGPPEFDLSVLFKKRNKEYNRTTPGGHIGGDENCSYYFDPKSGSSVMNCN
jgi:hypothetical protein